MKAILTYHSVDETGSVISVTPSELERHLDFLLAAGANVVPLSELARAAKSTDCIALTFDDGYSNFALSAVPQLAARGLTATVFVVPSFVGAHNDWEAIDSRAAVPRLPLMTWEEIARVRALGFDVGAHGLTHRSLGGTDAKSVTDEVEGCLAAFEKNLEARPDAFAFPYGDCDSSAIQIVSRAFSIACTTRFDIVRDDDSVHALPRLDMFYFRDGRMLKKWNTGAFGAYVRARDVSAAQCGVGCAVGTTMPDKLLSVVVPAHNAERHLASCLRALLATDLPRDAWELIVVDDASTDSTESIASQFADIVFRTGDVARGPSWARNRGAEKASGEIIAFVDADVSVHPDAMRIATGTLSANPGVVAVFGSYDDRPSDPSPVSRYRNLLHHYTHQQNAGRAASFWAGCGAVRASAFRAAGGFDEIRFAKPQIEDIELGYRLRRMGGIILEPSMQGTHHKRWSVASMMRTDFHDRAVPWVRLLLTAERAPGSTPSLGRRAMLSTAAAGVVAASIVAAVAGLGTPASMAAAGFFLLFIGLNASFYHWLNGRGGASLVLTAIPLHFAHQLLSALAVPIGATSFLLGNDGRPRDVHEPAREVAGTGFFPLAFGEIGARMIAFVATAWLARRLGASGFGQIAFATAVVAHFGTSLVQSAADLGVQDVARKPDHAREIASAGVALRLIVAVAAIIGIALVTSALGLDPERRTITLLYAVSIIPLALDTSWVFKGIGRTGVAAASLLIAQASSLVLVLALVSSPDHIRRVPLIQITGELLASSVLLVLLMRGHWVRPDFSLVRAMARRSGLFTVSRVLRTVIVSLDIVLLGILVSSQEVGWYSAAYRIVFFVIAIIYAAHVSFLPEIARSASDPRALTAILSRAIGLALAVTVPFVVGGILIAPSLMDRIFGSEYQSGAVALQLLLVSLAFLAVYGAVRNVFLTLHRPGLDTFNIACGVVANVILNLALIPRYGIEGAAVATVAGEAVMLAMAFAALTRLGIRPRLQESAPAMLAGIALGAALLAVPAPRPLIISVLGGGAVYVVALAASAMILARRRFIALSAERN